MKKIPAAFCLVILMVMTSAMHSEAVNTKRMPEKDSRELQYKDMLMLFLGPEIDEAVAEYYSKLLTENPIVYPYQIEVVKVERVNGFRGFQFRITIEVTPVVGPHISVGKDQLTFEVAPTIPNTVKLVNYQHLETHKLPPNWSTIIRKP